MRRLLFRISAVQPEEVGGGGGVLLHLLCTYKRHKCSSFLSPVKEFKAFTPHRRIGRQTKCGGFFHVKAICDLA